MKIKTTLTILFLKCFGFSETLNVPGDFSTIQLAIDVSSDFDTVLVSPGFYAENINYNGKNIVVTSTYIIDQDSSLVAQTIIDGDQDGSVAIFRNNENKFAGCVKAIGEQPIFGLLDIHVHFHCLFGYNFGNQTALSVPFIFHQPLCK